MSRSKLGHFGFLTLAVPAMVTFSGQFATAHPPVSELEAVNETAFFVGLQYRFGADNTPEFVIGVRNSRSNDTSTTYGSKLDLAFPIDAKKWQAPTLRVLGVYGGCNLQGEAGLGYSFGQQSLFVSVGGQAPHTNGGMNFSFNGAAMSGFVGINSLASPGCGNDVIPPSPPSPPPPP